MIKSKLIMVISSVGLVATLGVGCTSLSSKEGNTQDNIVKTEVKEEASNDVAKEEDNSDTNNNTTNNEANATKETKDSGNSINSSDENIVTSNTEVNNYDYEVESGVEEILNTPSCNKPSYNNPNTPNDTPSQDTSVPSEDSSTPSQDTNTPSEIPDEPVVSDSNYIAEIEQAIFQRVNQERTAAGLPALSYNITMEHYARIKSKDMGDNGYFSHEDLQGNLITEQMKTDGVSYKAWGENIAYIQGMNDNNSLATKFMDNWMNSSGHRANILSTNFSSIGIGVYKIGNTYYATQEFYR